MGAEFYLLWLDHFRIELLRILLGRVASCLQLLGFINAALFSRPIGQGRDDLVAASHCDDPVLYLVYRTSGGPVALSYWLVYRTINGPRNAFVQTLGFRVSCPAVHCRLVRECRFQAVSMQPSTTKPSGKDLGISMTWMRPLSARTDVSFSTAATNSGCRLFLKVMDLFRALPETLPSNTPQQTVRLEI